MAGLIIAFAALGIGALAGGPAGVGIAALILVILVVGAAC